MQAITSDSATIEVGADVYFRVKDAILSVANVQDLNYATRILCQTSLQRHISKQNLADIGSDNVVLTDALLVCVMSTFQYRTVSKFGCDGSDVISVVDSELSVPHSG